MLDDYSNLKAIVVIFDIDNSRNFKNAEHEQKLVYKFMLDNGFEQDGVMFCYIKDDLEEKEFLKKAIQVINRLSSLLYWSPIKTAKVIILSDKDESVYGGKIFSII